MFFGAKRKPGSKSVSAYQNTWIGPNLAGYLNAYQSTWDSQFSETRDRCSEHEAIDVANGIIDGVMEKLVAVASSDRIKQISDVPTAGAITFLGLLSQVVYAHAPAIADFSDSTADEVCALIVDALHQSIRQRSDELGDDFAKGAEGICAKFLTLVRTER